MELQNMNASWVDGFQWDSDDQFKGYGAFLKWAREKGIPEDFRPIDAFFIQRDLDSVEWWRNTLADQVKSLEEQIMGLKLELADLHAQIVELKLCQK